MKLAHLSDIHWLDFSGVPFWKKITGKRATGYANLLLRRQAHKNEIAQTLVADLATQAFDHVVVTGDLTNLALESEFTSVRHLLSTLSLPTNTLTIIPGNHDRYTRGSYRARRFEQFFQHHFVGDLTPGSPEFPSVRLRGPLAIISVDTAVPRAPLIAAGRTGTSQLSRLGETLNHPKVRNRAVVLLTHHPILACQGTAQRFVKGLRDARRMLQRLGNRPVLALHGHLHRRIVTTRHRLVSVGTASASLASDDPRKMAGYNIYAFDDNGALQSIQARILSTHGEPRTSVVWTTTDEPTDLDSWDTSGARNLPQ